MVIRRVSIDMECGSEVDPFVLQHDVYTYVYKKFNKKAHDFSVHIYTCEVEECPTTMTSLSATE